MTVLEKSLSAGMRWGAERQVDQPWVAVAGSLAGGVAPPTGPGGPAGQQVCGLGGKAAGAHLPSDVRLLVCGTRGDSLQASGETPGPMCRQQAGTGEASTGTVLVTHEPASPQAEKLARATRKEGDAVDSGSGLRKFTNAPNSLSIGAKKLCMD